MFTALSTTPFHFSTRTTTLERLHLLMGISPEDSRIQNYGEPKLIDPGVEYLQKKQKNKDYKLTVY